MPSIEVTIYDRPEWTECAVPGVDVVDYELASTLRLLRQVGAAELTRANVWHTSTGYGEYTYRVDSEVLDGEIKSRFLYPLPHYFRLRHGMCD